MFVPVHRYHFGMCAKKGRITLVCFWATWCAHGKHQLNDIAAAKRNGKFPNNVDVVSIATDETTMAHKILPYIRAKQWDFDCYIDEASRLKHVWGVSVFPYIMIVDKHCRVRYIHNAYTATNLLETEVKAIMN